MSESGTITRKSASNLALAFVLLPRPKREAMSALYAFCREVDDIADNEAVPAEQRRQTLAEWREDVLRACGKETPRFAVNRELQPVIHQYGLRFELFDDLLQGVGMDLDTKRYESYEQLDLYCYRVASVVGLLSIKVFGHRSPGCREYALHLGKALQFTNILRDVHNDAQRGRIYLPLSELKAFKVTEEEILRGEYSPRYYELARSAAQRARGFYASARDALPGADRRAMIAAELMGAVYWHLLLKLEQCRFNVFGPEPIGLSRPRKALLIARTWGRIISGSEKPNYG
jgi:phytoene synthase